MHSFNQSSHRGLECGPQNHGESPQIKDKDQQDDDQLKYEIKKILAHRQGALGSISYPVKWKGYDEAETTWEPGVSLRDTVALEDYELQLAITADRAHATHNCNCGTGRAQGRNHSYSHHTDSVAKHTSMRHKPPTRKGLPWSPDEFTLLSSSESKTISLGNLSGILTEIPWSD
jgi:hypothetical protein